MIIMIIIIITGVRQAAGVAAPAGAALLQALHEGAHRAVLGAHGGRAEVRPVQVRKNI